MQVRDSCFTDSNRNSAVLDFIKADTYKSRCYLNLHVVCTMDSAKLGVYKTVIKHTVSADLITKAGVDSEMCLSVEVQNKFGVF